MKNSIANQTAEDIRSTVRAGYGQIAKAEEERLAKFREVRDRIEARIKAWLGGGESVN
jgi:hypothetical protein